MIDTLKDCRHYNSHLLFAILIAILGENHLATQWEIDKTVGGILLRVFQ